MCYNTINDIQLTIDNPIDATDNDTYKRQQTDLKILRASEWARIKQLCWEVCAIHEDDDNVIESEIRLDLSQLHPELCTSLHTLLCFLKSNSLQITDHHPEFWLQVVNVDNDLATDNIIILTKYMHNILLTAITPYNEQDLFQWYDNNKEQLQSQFTRVHDTDIGCKERERHKTECHHWRMEEAQLQIETNRIQTFKSHDQSAAVARCAKARFDSTCQFPQKQLRSACRRQHCAFQADLRAKQEQQQIADIRQTQQLKE